MTPSPIRRAGRPAATAPYRLFCLPPAGAGPSLFFPWLDAAPPDIDVCPIALPGREDQFGQPLPASIAALADTLAEALAPALDRPYALLGYSMGALIAWELVQRWRRRGLRQPEVFFALAARAPSAQVPREVPLHALPAAAFRQTLIDIGGTPRELLDNADAMSLFEPILRNDLRIAETYRPGPDAAPLDGPLHAVFGSDDALMTRDDVAPWSACTRGPFRLHELPAPHMLPRPQLVALMPALAGWWRRG
ncbi:thioesterase domain-containing protein [Aquincola sp. MAHUQ-54]|uniref:Thioesterase domain-containing protein n=1 Tax=Aquincola agrisoli TaxID=3119538 RepID=A0AAW9QCL6_9BURK